ncbi:type I toxin-antitoxin system SymE family toxin [Pantoea agglomerans]|uniref:SymE family type I addiction module toxin n=1 Tax=Enterobacter agglomerans TaxID=549 RepID=UPI001F255990|nr:SymE family type I addiction module toxin [Pantoea agglomerans]UIL51046.1 type I toxin-antitoxin system SymE family toxin [Pantoea agglomerans]
MAETHHKPGTTTSTTAASRSQAHYYRVGYRPNRGQPSPLPQLTINGRWLEALGFMTGQKIEVITGPGQLIIRLAEE